jgi:6-phosphofructo-2-kinase / fructose-2,6-biphosphatase 3
MIGACDGMTYEEIEQTFPEEFVRRENDKLAYRYPR